MKKRTMFFLIAAVLFLFINVQQTFSQYGLNMLKGLSMSVPSSLSIYTDWPEHPSYRIKTRIFIRDNMEEGTQKMRSDISKFLPLRFDDSAAFGIHRPWQWKHKDDFNENDEIDRDVIMKKGIVELAQIEVRNDLSDNPSYRESQYGLLKDNGWVVDQYGDERGVRFEYNEGMTPSKVYIIITTPKGLSVMSAEPQPIALLGITTYDFTTRRENFYLDGGVEIMPGVWGMAGGDCAYWGNVSAGDNFIDMSDASKVKREMGKQSGYYSSDLNYDGSVDGLDLSIVYKNYYDSSRVPRIYDGTDGSELFITDNTNPTYILNAGGFTFQDSTLRFDIFIKRTSNEFLLKGAQLVLNVDPNLGMRSASYSNLAITDHVFFSTPTNQIRLSTLTNTGSSVSLTDSAPGLRLATISVVCTSGVVGNNPLPVTWKNFPITEFVTKIAALVDNQVLEVTTPETHFIDMATTVSNNINQPVNYSLEQNYPNPFNPTTTITYSILKQEVVDLKVFDMIGREVWNKSYGAQVPGTYEVTFNASNLTSGTYFYRLEAGDFVATKKMTLIK